MLNKRNTIYLDHASTSPLDPRVLETMMPFLTECCGNPSSPHAEGRRARVAVEEARSAVAEWLEAEPSDIVFTSGGTESDNMALRGVFEDRAGGHLVTSSAEHKAVLETARWLERSGVDVTYLTPGSDGRISRRQVAAALRSDTLLVSVMHTNNETGAVNPIPEIADVCRSHGVLIHCDAVQAASWTSVSARSLGVDLLSLSAHKVSGPKGTGILYVRSDRFEISRLIHGGAQERDRRGGTENVAAIVGMAAAFDRAQNGVVATRATLDTLRQRLLEGIQERIPGPVRVNSPAHPEHAAPHILSVSFPPDGGQTIDGEMLLLNLDVAGVFVSSGSACTSGAIEPSHVLQAMDVEPDTAQATVRFSLGHQNTVEEMDVVVERLTGIIGRMRGPGNRREQQHEPRPN